LPDLLRRHSHPLAGGAVLRHGRARDSVVNRAKKIAVGLAVAFLWTGQIRTTATAARAKAVAERAVGAELRFTGSNSLRIVGERICVLCLTAEAGKQQQPKDRSAPQQHAAKALGRVAAETGGPAFRAPRRESAPLAAQGFQQ
jgi:hypothetical protein